MQSRGKAGVRRGIASGIEASSRDRMEKPGKERMRREGERNKASTELQAASAPVVHQ